MDEWTSLPGKLKTAIMPSSQTTHLPLTTPAWRRRLFPAIVLLLALVWIAITRAEPGSTTDGEIQAPQAGFTAPDFTLEGPDGQPVALSELRGRPVLVNLWATWCPPCRAEMPAIQQVYDDYRDQGFLVLAVNATSQDDPGAAVRFMQEHELDFPLLFDPQGEVIDRYRINAFPTSYFIDADGVIREVVVGGPMSEALLRIRVEQLFERQGEGD